MTLHLVFLALNFLMVKTYETGGYLTRTYSFPHHSYLTGVRHIHTPEECIDPYALLPTGFRVLYSCPPERLHSYWIARFTYTTDMGARNQAVIFSSERASSQVLFFSEHALPHLLASLSIRSLSTGGFKLLVTGTRLQTPSPLELILTARIPQTQPIICQNHGHNLNLTRYRLMVLRQLG